MARSSIKPDYLGLRLWIKTPHGMIGVYDGRLADMDTFSGRWQTVCESHGTILSHTTLALARAHAHDPSSWCDLDPNRNQESLASSFTEVPSL